MRALTPKAMTKRGCMYCLDHTKKRLEPDSTKRSHVCIHDECPYHELDPYDTYAQYLKSPAQRGFEDAIKRLVNYDGWMPK